MPAILPIGLTVFDVTGEGNLDLMVGNSLGDVTTLPGNGNGTFQPFTRIDQNMAISVGDLDGDGKPDWVIANNTSDRVVVQNALPRRCSIAAPEWRRRRV